MHSRVLMHFIDYYISLLAGYKETGSLKIQPPLYFLTSIIFLHMLSWRKKTKKRKKIKKRKKNQQNEFYFHNQIIANANLNWNIYKHPHGSQCE